MGIKQKKNWKEKEKGVEGISIPGMEVFIIGFTSTNLSYKCYTHTNKNK